MCIRDSIGIGGFAGQYNIACVGFFPCQKLGIKHSIGLLGIIFARDHLGDHILRDGKEIVGGDADIHVVFFHHRAHVLHGVGQVVAYALAVAEQVLPFRKDLFLRILRQHNVQDLDVYKRQTWKWVRLFLALMPLARAAMS